MARGELAAAQSRQKNDLKIFWRDGPGLRYGAPQYCEEIFATAGAARVTLAGDVIQLPGSGALSLQQSRLLEYWSHHSPRPAQRESGVSLDQSDSRPVSHNIGLNWELYCHSLSFKPQPRLALFFG